MLRRASLLCLLVTSCASFSLAQEVVVSLKDLHHRAHLLQGGFFTEASQPVIWQLLTDYSSISKFSSMVRSSRVTQRKDETVFVKQEAVVNFLIFSKDVTLLLKVTEKPTDEIDFEEVSGKDFEFYAGSWRISQVQGGYWVLYTLSV